VSSDSGSHRCGPRPSLLLRARSSCAELVAAIWPTPRGVAGRRPVRGSHPAGLRRFRGGPSIRPTPGPLGGRPGSNLTSSRFGPPLPREPRPLRVCIKGDRPNWKRAQRRGHKDRVASSTQWVECHPAQFGRFSSSSSSAARFVKRPGIPDCGEVQWCRVNNSQALMS
jgi:hypothetical protein